MCVYMERDSSEAKRNKKKKISLSLDPDRSGHVQRSLVRSAHSVPRSMDRPDEGVGAYLSMVLPCLSYYIDSSVEEQR
jgi:hypothetical protein